MDPHLSILLENKVRAIAECNYILKQNRFPEEDIAYTIKMKDQYLNEIKALIETHAELAHHAVLIKIKKDLKCC